MGNGDADAQVSGIYAPVVYKQRGGRMLLLVHHMCMSIYVYVDLSLIRSLFDPVCFHTPKYFSNSVKAGVDLVNPIYTLIRGIL